jgi:hypothetical protein
LFGTFFFAKKNSYFKLQMTLFPLFVSISHFEKKMTRGKTKAMSVVKEKISFTAAALKTGEENGNCEPKRRRRKEQLHFTHCGFIRGRIDFISQSHLPSVGWRISSGRSSPGQKGEEEVLPSRSDRI